MTVFFSSLFTFFTQFMHVYIEHIKELNSEAPTKRQIIRVSHTLGKYVTTRRRAPIVTMYEKVESQIPHCLLFLETNPRVYSVVRQAQQAPVAKKSMKLLAYS